MTTSELRAPHLVALRPAAVFDGIGARFLRDATVLIERDCIVAVETARVELPDDVRVVDLPGCTLLPGLVDTHVHLCFDGGVDPVTALADRDDDAALAAMTLAAQQQLHAGVTTVRDLGDRGYLSLHLRERSAEDATLPTILTAGPPLTTPDGHCHFLGGVVSAPGAAAVRAAVAEHVQRGVDVIKVMASGGHLTPGSDGEISQFGPEELRAAVDEAHRHGLPITAHAHSTSCIAAALDAGVDGIEHCSFFEKGGVHAPDVLIERIARRRVVVGATLGVTPGVTPPPFLAEKLDAMRATLARLRDAGAPLVAASDAGIGFPKPHGILPLAAKDLTDIGFATHEALRAMTLEAARVCGLGDRKGRIAAGYDADLLAVDGDPFRDLDALTRVAAVYRHGVRVGTEVDPS